ncbi:hypothetical protein MRB53_036001 [Persea americana]|uniref:Uncharacterized protein n=1 Tax=Persea americana TaxID=3435 RepID=A0ACC2K683_PERAE|nr:hypothetical protein MRB53_036001 [Persea americana]
MELGEPQRVQALVQSGLSHLPSQYIQPPESQPSARRRPSESGVPVVDLFHFDPNRSDDLRQQVWQLCHEWGAFQVVNHGVPRRLLDEIRTVGFSFFNSPMPEKLKYNCDGSGAATEGYGSRMLTKDDGVLDWRDYFDHHTFPLSRRNPTRWPDSPPNYREVVTEYSECMKVLAQKLLRIISEGLSLPCSFIEEAVGEVYQNITISYYPPCPQPELALGLQAHSDMGAITLLVQDEVEGLEVLKDGEWVTVQPLSDAIVVILADQTEIISNGEYISAQHRAIVNAHQPRLSVATFYDPSKARKISPASELVTEYSPLRYHGVMYGDYVSAWYSKGPEGKRNIDALLVHH